MEVLIGLIHIAAAYLASLLIELYVDDWILRREILATEKLMQKIAKEIGVSFRDVSSLENLPMLLDHLSYRYSAEHLKNRISDVLGILTVTLNHFRRALIYIIIGLALIILLLNSDLILIYSVWLVVLITPTFRFFALVLNWLSLALFDRIVGEPSIMRKYISEERERLVKKATF